MGAYKCVLLKIVLFSVLRIMQGDPVENAFLDGHSYKINWNSFSARSLHVTDVRIDGYEGPILMSTHRNQSFDCYIPVDLPSQIKTVTYEDAADEATQLLQAIFERKSCSIRMEPYWIYELCHGNYIRQFHQEKNSDKTEPVITKEYILGKYTDSSKVGRNKGHLKKMPTIDLAGVQEPYLEVEMSQGTPCDILNNVPRKTLLRYICFQGSSENILSVIETNTCSYEILVTSDSLCRSPVFQSQKLPIGEIHCFAKEPGYEKSEDLVAFEQELQPSKQKSVNKHSVLEPGDHEIDDEPEKVGTFREGQDRKFPQHLPPEIAPVVEDLLDFLSGQFCVHGGTGYWRFKFCFGKTVIQYHEEQDPEKGTKHQQVIVLGVWDLNHHLAWLQKHPHKKPSTISKRKSISYHYGNGEICDLSGKPRQTLVKLKCVESSSSSEIVLYLQEPQSCNYILWVEGAIFCHLMPFTDENGLVDQTGLKSAITR